jgi:hypothetical protein
MQEPLRQQIFKALMRTEGSEHSEDLKELEEMTAEDLRVIEPIVDRVIMLERIHAVEEYQKFLYERHAGRADFTHDLRVTFEILGGHTHFHMRTGKQLGRCNDADICMTNEEFTAWRTGTMNVEFVEKHR